MKIFVIPTTDWIGHPVLERQHQVFERLAEKHDVHVLRLRYYKETRLKTKTTVHEVDDSIAGSIALYYLKNAVKHRLAIKRIMESADIDVAVLSNLLPVYVGLDILSRVPTVFDLSDHFPSSGAGYYFRIESTVGRMATLTIEQILKSILRKVDCTVACSYPLGQYAKNLGAKTATVIPNGVSEVFLAKRYTGDYIREKYNISRDAVVLGFVGMIEFWVNMTPVLEAVRALRRDQEVKLLLVGRQFQSPAENQLEREIRELGIGNNVIWPDRFVPYEELPNYIAAMDLCSIPFKHSHPTAYFSAPNKLWEYFALAKPVITSPLPEVLIQAHEFVNVGTTGEDYERIVRDYVAHPDRYKDQAEAAQRLAAKRTWGAISERYEELLASVATRQMH